ncbi:MAG: hypothetical protein QOD82_7444 [Pseudonocardiales bacterium]|nr:hypothetical protein [Pseudonocardiales bacterium]
MDLLVSKMCLPDGWCYFLEPDTVLLISCPDFDNRSARLQMGWFTRSPLSFVSSIYSQTSTTKNVSFGLQYNE